MCNLVEYVVTTMKMLHDEQFLIIFILFFSFV